MSDGSGPGLPKTFALIHSVGELAGKAVDHLKHQVDKAHNEHLKEERKKVDAHEAMSAAMLGHAMRIQEAEQSHGHKMETIDKIQGYAQGGKPITHADGTNYVKDPKWKPEVAPAAEAKPKRTKKQAVTVSTRNGGTRKVVK